MKGFTALRSENAAFPAVYWLAVHLFNVISKSAHQVLAFELESRGHQPVINGPGLAHQMNSVGHGILCKALGLLFYVRQHCTFGCSMLQAGQT